MQAQQLETTDIYKSAVFLCNGGRLADVRLKERRRGIVSFLIEGEGILELDLDYRNGRAQVNANEEEFLFPQTRLKMVFGAPCCCIANCARSGALNLYNLRELRALRGDTYHLVAGKVDQDNLSKTIERIVKKSPATPAGLIFSR